MSDSPKRKPTRTVLVRCTFTLPVEVPTDMDDESVHSLLEDNGCPGTGRIGAALDDHIRRYDEQGYCWACALKAKTKIVKR